jgi:SAM-dependent methyltransferase
MNKENYLNMQKACYNRMAGNWSLTHRNPVVGNYDKHNTWPDYKDFLFKDIETEGKIALDYGSGPGRNIVNMRLLFDRIDGCDISEVNKEKATVNANHHGVTDFNYYVCDGQSIPCEDNVYDIVFSVICLQHICVHEVRNEIFKNIYRVLKPGGYFCWQMGYGGKPPVPKGKRPYQWCEWNDSIYGAEGTNSAYDVSITDENQVKDDILDIGFKSFDFDIRPTGPGDNHFNWIYMRAQK